ncbi:MAG: hypothetical protein PQJ61_03045 [Spirochaetales bacterium]|uniref:Uncharacterized protein n=1 Tax=Candidatus Thalassospirochaeta sargassi TaxID=3119039 RepID=A0AAJ1MMT5_9SPIO|nr:hypothetical protein [Spirochaetales bacterium]
MRNAEYDRFGPWILEITETDPLPPLFIPYATRKDASLLSIKIPRPIDRRSATPGMNLYDYVLNMYKDDFDILRREGEEVVKDNFNYCDIFCIKNSEVLLNGSLSLFTKDDNYTFPYNTVSSDIIYKIIHIVRERYTKAENMPSLNEITPEDGELDFYFSTLASAEKEKETGFKLFSYQSRIKLNQVGKSGLRNLFNLIISKQLMESLHFCNGREVKIIGKGRDFKYIGQTDYGKEDCYIPLEKITGTEIAANSSNPGLLDCIIHTADKSFTTIMSAENPTAAEYLKLN